MEKLKAFVAGKGQKFFALSKGWLFVVLAKTPYKFSGLVSVIFLFLFCQSFFPSPSLAFSPKNKVDFVLNQPIATKTKSLFSEKTILKVQAVNFQREVKEDPSLQNGAEQIIQEGKNGSLTLETKIVFHSGTEFSRETKVIEKTSPQNEIVAIGPSGGTVTTPYGSFDYSKKLTVWATSYDSSCKGCSGLTATGLKAGFGVIAVDPKVIPLGSKVYVPGYGLAVAGDTGGSIKGNRIDLGFEDLKTASWKAHSTDIYLLTN